ncbi:hypothetical protein SDC9_117755 [bioreactor metagenome]|uniref:HTH cro/C1-type domain-containing protein n=1 Tax=bioreactor metagenome TaxID=1076179 RepID=A0A645BZV1_9ZZZZ
MSLAEQIRITRQRSLMTQEQFAESLGVSFSTVNRWESGKMKPSISNMKSLKFLCQKNEIDYQILEEEWINENNCKEYDIR